MNKKLTEKFAPGYSTCAGCGIPAIVRHILDATDNPVVVINATGCLEVTSTLYPYTAWKVPYIHNAFENAGATASGVETAYRILKRKGKLKDDIKFVVFAGDGGTYDIGLQALSGMLERGHDVLFVNYNNEGYMNTGGQRSGATPRGANMATTPTGSHCGRIDEKEDENCLGSRLERKDIMGIVRAHHIPYLAQANVAYIEDLKMKAKKAFQIQGPKFLHVFQPCTNVWKFPISDYVKVGKLATETNYWPLYEIEKSKYKINLKIEKRKPIRKYLETQKRFKHLLQPKNKKTISWIQKDVDKKWRELSHLSESNR